METFAAKEIGDDGARGADWFIDEENGLRRVEGTEAMMVDDFGDEHFVGAGHGLSDFVVVHEHEAGGNGLQDVGLGDDADERTVVGDHGNGVGVAGRESLADVGDPDVGTDGRNVAFDDAFDGGGGANHPRGGGGIVGADDDADAAGFGEFEGIVVGLEIARNDERADAELDGATLDIMPVADDDDGFVRGDVLPDGYTPERGNIHRAQTDVELLDFFIADDVEGAGVQGAGDIGERSIYLPHGARFTHAGDKNAAECGEGNDAGHTSDAFARAGHGQDADVVAVEEFEGLGAGGMFGNGKHLRRHEVTHARGDVAQVIRQRSAETRENGIDPGIGVATAGGDVAAFTARVFESRIGDRRTDGVSIGILVTDDVGRGRGGRGMGGGRHGTES